MTIARLRPVALAIVCLAFPLPSDAKPGRSDARRVTQPVALGKKNPSGLGKREPGLAYVSVPRRAFMPAAFLTSGVIAQAGSVPSVDNEHTRYESGTAPVFLPDGARLRSLSCFGSGWDHKNNVGKGIKLDARGLAGSSETVGKATFNGGSGPRRLDAKLDHVVDNFTYGYELRVSLDVDAQISGCRIGYEPGYS